MFQGIFGADKQLMSNGIALSDAANEMERLNAEREKAARMNAAAFAGYSLPENAPEAPLDDDE